MEYVDLMPEILSFLPQAPEPLLEQQIRRAVRTFCHDTQFLRIESSPKLDMVALQPEYQVSDPQGTNIVRVLEVWDDEVKLIHRSPDQLSREAEGGPKTNVIVYTRSSVSSLAQYFHDPWESEIGEPQFFHSNRPSTFRLVPIPETSKTALLKIIVAVKPNRTSTGVDNFIMDNWYETIVNGALANMYAVPKKAWSDAGLERLYRDKFDKTVADALADRLAGFDANDHVVGRVRAYP